MSRKRLYALVIACLAFLLTIPMTAPANPRKQAAQYRHVHHGHGPHWHGHQRHGHHGRGPRWRRHQGHRRHWGPGLIDVDITGKARAGMSTTCAVTGPAAIIGPGITIRPTCTLPMFTYLASTCTSCFLCTDGRTNTEAFGCWFSGSSTAASLCRFGPHRHWYRAGPRRWAPFPALPQGEQ